VEKVQMVVAAAKKKKIPIRIGINAGSLEKDILAKYKGKVTAAGMVESAMRHIRILEKLKFMTLRSHSRHRTSNGRSRRTGCWPKKWITLCISV